MFFIIAKLLPLPLFDRVMPIFRLERKRELKIDLARFFDLSDFEFSMGMSLLKDIKNKSNGKIRDSGSSTVVNTF